jgi:voltage-gated sodium channel
MINHKKFNEFVNSKSFHKVITTAIILCSIILGLETFARSHFWYSTFKWIDIFFTVFFVTEIILRVLAERHPIRFFMVMTLQKTRKPEDPFRFKIKYKWVEQGFWNWFDLIIVVLSIVGMVSHFFEHPEFLVIARLFRIFRILRLFEVSEQLRSIEKRILSVIPTVFSFAMLLMILLYIFSIIGIYLFDFKNYGKANFSDLANASITLFQIMTLDGWADVMNEVREHITNWPPFVPLIYFISFVTLTAIVTFNVFVAVLTSQVEERVVKDMEANEQAIKTSIALGQKNTEEDLKEGLKTLLTEISHLKKELAEIKSSVNTRNG